MPRWASASTPPSTALQQRTLEERRRIANAADFDLHVQGFARGAGQIPPVPVFQPPAAIVRRNTRATLVIEDPQKTTRHYTQVFILTQVDREAKERWQLLATFGGFDPILCGSDPVVFTCTGHIFDGAEVATDWYNRFWELYEGSLRGSVAVQQGRSIYLYYSGRIVHGVDFSWVMLVLSDTPIGQPDESADPAGNLSGGGGTEPLAIGGALADSQALA